MRVLGYLLARNNWNAALDKIDLSKYTDINIAFVNPDQLGNFSTSDALKSATDKIHQHHARAFVSIAGGNPPAYFKSLLTDEKRPQVIKNLVSFVLQYNFDGVDVDIENDLIDQHYGPFVRELSIALKLHGKLMTSAQATWNGSKIKDSTFQRFDFINVMSYDQTGPWNKAKPGPHSPLSMTAKDFAYFNGERHIPAEKLYMGVPFYGYGFGKGAPEDMHYGDIVRTYPGAEQKDSVLLPQGGKIYYNGIATIQQKVQFMKEHHAGGVMIWEIQQDAKNEKSLLKAIHDIL